MIEQFAERLLAEKLARERGFDPVKSQIATAYTMSQLRVATTTQFLDEVKRANLLQ